MSKAVPQSRCRGSSASMYTRGKRTQHGKVDSVVGRVDQPEAGDGHAGCYGVEEKPVVPGKSLIQVDATIMSSLHAAGKTDLLCRRVPVPG